jgi:hypothetical protein
LSFTEEPPGDLTGLLAPLDEQTFLQTCWGQTFQHVAGAKGKFSQLLPWTVLNCILEQHRLDTPRIRLTREGKPVPAASFLSHQTSRKASHISIPRLRTAELTDELRQGATLVLDAVDELHRPITELAAALERVFRVRIQVNAYAGWRTSHGFDLHWDDHDVFILQVAGRKHWKVYGMTRKYPLARDVVPAADPPTEPVWEGLLQDGDLLYIPRGWWHVATPLDEPTLHLTVGVSNPTGADLLTWFVDRLRASEEVRRDLPQFEGLEQQCVYLNHLREIFLRDWRPDLIQRYLNDMDAKSQPRPRLGLPWAAMPGMLPPADFGFCVKWNGPRTPQVARNGPGQIEMAANGRRWKFAEAAAPVLDLLVSGRPCSVVELHEAAAGTLDVNTIRAFLGELVSSGLVVVSEGRTGL